MKDQLNWEQIDAIAEQCRQMRSEAIYDSFAVLINGLRLKIAELIKPAYARIEYSGSRIVAAQDKRESLLTENTGYGWRRIIAD